MYKRMTLTIAMVVLACALAGCARHAARSAATSRPAPSRGTHVDTESGLQLSWDRTWQRRQSADYVLALAPAGSDSEAQGRITLDVPKLPPHIRGLIPIGSVRNGYLDDLRQQYQDLQTADLPPPVIADAKTRLVRSTWGQSSHPWQETALLLVHDDHVYILRGQSDIEHEPATRRAFDDIVQSLRWMPPATQGN